MHSISLESIAFAPHPRSMFIVVGLISAFPIAFLYVFILLVFSFRGLYAVSVQFSRMVSVVGATMSSCPISVMSPFAVLCRIMSVRVEGVGHALSSLCGLRFSPPFSFSACAIFHVPAWLTLCVYMKICSVPPRFLLVMSCSLTS